MMNKYIEMYFIFADIMSNSYFQFKQFTVFHDRCAMKVGTDGVLLGAWTRTGQGCSILDIGTGTGLIALILAQRVPDARITAVELDREASLQAAENVRNSPWAARIEVVEADIRQYATRVSHPFDIIVSNPPFFNSSLHSPSEARTQARHTDSLSYTELLQGVCLLLADGGEFSVIIPSDSATDFIVNAAGKGLYLHRRTNVRTLSRAQPKRVLLAFGKSVPAGVITDELVIATQPGIYTEAYRELTRDLYLDK